MPWFGHNAFFYPILLVVALLLIFKGGTRGKLCVAMLLLVVAIGDGLICKSLKDAIGRLRPYDVLPETNLLLGKGGSGSMPSSHAANWFSGVMVAWIFYRRSWRFMLPLAVLVAFSRVYCGVHFPADVLMGAVLGLSYAAAIVFGVDWIWKVAGQRWFPLLWQKLPSMRCSPNVVAPVPNKNPQTVSLDQHWLRLGYVLIFLLLAIRLGYLAAAKIQLSEDEAYQWLWSKHLALSYFSKPPIIAYLQAIGTSIFGDTELGVRFFSPVMAAAMAFLILRFVAREVNAQAGFVSVLILSTAPLLAVGSILMTIDPPLVLFWTAAMFAGWRAMGLGKRPSVERTSSAWWALAGLFLGLSFLSKYAALFQLICWALFFILWKPARVHLRKPGPYLAIAIFAVCTLPVWIWNSQNGWITVEHVSHNAGRNDPWQPTLRYFNDFVFSQAALLNPVLFLAAIWAMFAFWKKDGRNPLFIFLFSMGAPVFIGYAAFTVYKRVFPNWIAPSIIPLFLLMIAYWHRRWVTGTRWVKPVTITGIALGAVVVILMHDTNLIGKIAGRTLPATSEPMRRVRTWDQVAKVVGEEWKKLSNEGTASFIIAAHYGLVGEISFYLPEAQTAAHKRDPIAYYISSDTPQNQFFFWPEYRYREHRKGQNAIFVHELNIKDPIPEPVPEKLKTEFASVEDLGTREIKYRDGRVFRVIQVFACRNLQ